MIQIVGEQGLNTFVTGLAQFCQQIQRQFHVRCDQQFASAFIDVVFSNDFTNDIVNRDFDMIDAIFFQLTNMTRSNATTFLDVNSAVCFNIKDGCFTTQTLRNQFHLQFVVADFIHNFFKEQVKDLFSSVVQRTQNNTGRQFTTTVNTDEQIVFRVELEVQP